MEKPYQNSRVVGLNVFQSGLVKFALAIVVVLSGCEFGGPFSLVNDEPDFCCPGSGGVGYGYSLGSFYGDSVQAINDDSIRLFGHFTPFPGIIGDTIKVAEFGIQVSYYTFTYNYPKYPTITETTWIINNPDTVISAVVEIPEIPCNCKATFNVYSRIYDDKGDDLLFYASRSPYTIKTLREPYAYMSSDSVAFIDNSRAIIWSHFEAVEPTEILELAFSTYHVDEGVVEDDYMYKYDWFFEAGSTLSFNDTIDVVAGGHYWWSARARTKFSNDSISYTYGKAIEFYAPNN